jgi:hypothetical protein
MIARCSAATWSLPKTRRMNDVYPLRQEELEIRAPGLCRRERRHGPAEGFHRSAQLGRPDLVEELAPVSREELPDADLRLRTGFSKIATRILDAHSRRLACRLAERSACLCTGGDPSTTTFSRTQKRKINLRCINVLDYVYM